jgi:hypothetical protein
MSESLERDLARAGIAASVEVRDRLALLIPRDADASLTSEAQRRVALALAAEAGFTHVALELLD